jgi:hypothetical protein
MIPFHSLAILGSFTYSGEMTELSSEEALEYSSISNDGIDVATMVSSTTSVNLATLFIAVLYAICILMMIYVYFIIFAWWLEHSHPLGTWKISFFKILTFGKISADQVDAKHLIGIFVLAHGIIFLVMFGYIKDLIQWILLFVIKLIRNLGGGR